ncbi:MAG TPA: cysteine desulfurase [Methanobacteriaceae archaeon]|nr:cysteine desulfurase [Methanobacteriaceae archaeon]
MKTIDMRADIPLLDDIIYMDAASTTPTPNPVVEAMCDYYHHYNVNTGRGAYKLAIKATQKLDDVRKKVADWVNVEPLDIIFTKNTTEAINMVSHGLKFKKGDKIVVSNMEHHSNIVPWLYLQKKGVEVEVIKADPEGVIDPSDVEKALDENTKLLTVTHISNSIGSVQPVKELGEIARNNGSLYLVDVAQSLGHMKLDLKQLNADFITAPGHKGLLGPVGTGFLCCAQELQEKMEPVNLGGGTVDDVGEADFKLTEVPHRFEGGTQNIGGLIGLGAAVDYVKRIGTERIEKHGKRITKQLYNQISTIDGVVVYGRPENIYGIVSFNIDGMNPHDLAKILDETKNICVRSGHHCAISAMKHLGTYDMGGTVRASFHYYNTKEEVETLGETIEQISGFWRDK